MAGFLLAAYGAKRFFTVDTFYEYGHYRGAAVAEIASEKPRFKGTAYCLSCHAEQAAKWSAGVHNAPDQGRMVKCEVCHGPGGGRDKAGAFKVSATGPDHPQNLKLEVPTDSRSLCTLCHERIAGRPAAQRQINVQEHAGDQQCVLCHDPHSPRLNLPARPAAGTGNAALGKAKAAACAGCHGETGVSAGLPGPTLAGQKEAYLLEALTAYRNGSRRNEMMSPMAQATSGEDAGNLAAYFAGLKCQSTLAAAVQSSPAAARCAACHGAAGVSTNPGLPNLAGQTHDYLAAALKAYRSGARKNGLMTTVAKTMSDAEIEAAANYYADARCR